ncbi:MAG: STAS/SEC14 domain-containing protein [Pseudomonadota bacterium]
MFDIWFDKTSAILHLTLSGHWTAEDFAQFQQAYAAALEEATANNGSIGLLSDSREFPVQSQDVASRFSELTKQSFARIAASAIVVGSVLNKVQAERTMKSDRLKVFLDEEEARDWLRSNLQDRND